MGRLAARTRQVPPSCSNTTAKSRSRHPQSTRAPSTASSSEPRASHVESGFDGLKRRYVRDAAGRVVKIPRRRPGDEYQLGPGGPGRGYQARRGLEGGIRVPRRRRAGRGQQRLRRGEARTRSPGAGWSRAWARIGWRPTTTRRRPGYACVPRAASTNASRATPKGRPSTPTTSASSWLDSVTSWGWRLEAKITRALPGGRNRTPAPRRHPAPLATRPGRAAKKHEIWLRGGVRAQFNTPGRSTSA